MKSLTPTILVCFVAFLAVAQSPKREQSPPGALEKIIASLPEKPFAKPEKPRKILVFSKTNGFRHESIASGKIALEEMGRKTGALKL